MNSCRILEPCSQFLLEPTLEKLTAEFKVKAASTSEGDHLVSKSNGRIGCTARRSTQMKTVVEMTQVRARLHTAGWVTGYPDDVDKDEATIRADVW
jgi:hypothetical protein